VVIAEILKVMAIASAKDGNGLVRVATHVEAVI